MSHVEKINSLLSDSSIEHQRQGIALFESLTFQEQLDIGFLPFLASGFEEIQEAIINLITSLPTEEKAQCWDSMFLQSRSLMTELQSTIGLGVDSKLLNLYLSKLGKDLKGLR